MYYVLLGIFTVSASCAVLYRLYAQTDASSLKPDDPRAELKAYQPVIDPGAILLMFALYSGVLVFSSAFPSLIGKQSGTYEFSSKIGGVLLNALLLLLIYYSLMLPLFPLLKRVLRPASCSALWILPNVIYVIVYLIHSFTEQNTFRLVLRAKGSWPLWVPGIWLIGFLAVMGHGIASHLILRQKLLADAVPWNAPGVQSRWKAIKQEYGLKEKHFSRPLYRSPSLTTPLSVGLLNRSTCVIFPENDYTEEEWDLILRHELLHLIHRDPLAKLFICFTQALFWFNPLIWLSSRSLSEDLERTCDELVLGDAPEEMRQRYAGLLLQSAADPRGFTTCLSASARSLKDRLTEVLHPVRRRKGVLLILLMIVALIASSGRFVLAYGEAVTVKNAVLNGEAIYPDEWKTIFFYENGNDLAAQRYQEYLCRDPEAFVRALEELPVYRTLGIPAPGNGPMIVSDPVPFGSAQIASVRVTQLAQNYFFRTGNGTYYIETEDWERLFALFEELSEEKPE